MEDKTFQSIKKICRKEAIINIIFGYSKDLETKEVKRLNLPEEIDLEYIKDTMLPKFLAKGFEIQEIRKLSEEEIKKFPSTWAKKISLTKDRQYFYLQLKKAAL